MYYIDYFLGAQYELDDPEYEFPMYLSKMGDLIKRGVRSRKPDVRIKYMWMREKVNEVIELSKNNKFLNSLEQTNPELADVWRKMKKF